MSVVIAVCTSGQTGQGCRSTAIALVFSEIYIYSALLIVFAQNGQVKIIDRYTGKSVYHASVIEKIESLALSSHV